MTKIKIYFLLAFLVISVLFVVSIHEIKNQYDEELTSLRLELARKKQDNRMLSLAIESLMQQVEGKKQIECDFESGLEME